VLTVSDHGEHGNDGESGDAADEPAGVGGPVLAEGGWTAIVMPGEVDIANAEQAGTDLLATVQRGCPVVIVDMSRTTFCDCAGVSVLLAAASKAELAGVRVRVVARAGPVLRMFALTGLPRAVPVYATIEDAVRGPPVADPALLAFRQVTSLLRRRQQADVR